MMADNIETVGADPSVCPLEHKNKFDNTLNIKGRTLEPKGRELNPKGRTLEPKGRELNPKGRALEPKGRTHGSAPTQYKHNRRSLRLKHYDYSRAGFYFITVCTQNKEHLFGSIVEGIMDLNEAGEMVESWHRKLEDKFPNIKNHEMVIMPNHIHFIMEIVGVDPCVRPNVDVNKIMVMNPKRADIEPQRADTWVRPYVGDVVQWFKTMTTNTYIKMVKNSTLPPFNKRIWQRNYYEHVIRDDVDYERVAMYTINNPKTWDNDALSKP